ncbi:type VII toxin-antitoxin system HepT family RNase toxin [Ornithinibacillus halophilus]|uniref:Uncharacterized conserved protein YutE, UPF0331/DUF86 family n=1 Tax=Ornithinibacillus halophilus TaxID=930117 RepID=A0A1M5JPA2_9BACI|nr:DUF86 domain-containing protein [Ornithinibacillus halophilus]SHG42235.1 Uncharacterized conserved protein YutE, UPF0331/DUF86 family [Ornithinibacillus halophilus]
MYFVDRKKIEEILEYMDKLLNEINEHNYNSFVHQLALERLTQMIIESIIDVGNMMIDGFIMRDPGSYEDIIDILVDEKVIPGDEEANYKAVINLRKHLVKEYMQVDHEALVNTLSENKAILDKFSTYIREYLINELGVANAFSNE